VNLKNHTKTDILVEKSHIKSERGRDSPFLLCETRERKVHIIDINW